MIPLKNSDLNGAHRKNVRFENHGKTNAVDNEVRPCLYRTISTVNFTGIYLHIMVRNLILFGFIKSTYKKFYKAKYW